ncbi:DinB family protein [Aestuariimicrobium kwangyangense]|uniref:DinB family protein n=1 Tax=Aestuariimicrobium kwangyangense TaxID=396389 RepID=UPI0003B5FABB|nr:DinB family protein [Aestuariimicrobium kwangyangense]
MTQSSGTTGQPTTPPTDDKDWTFVTTQGCPDCGYMPTRVDEVGARVRATIDPWRHRLAADDVRQRPTETTWSPLEYGCHVRDVCILFRQRLGLMVTSDNPTFANWDQDQAAVEGRYWDEDPAEVAEQYAVEAERTAAAFDAVTPDQWDRPSLRSNGSSFTVETFAAYFLHDLEHHAHDVGISRAG